MMTRKIRNEAHRITKGRTGWTHRSVGLSWVFTGSFRVHGDVDKQIPSDSPRSIPTSVLNLEDCEGQSRNIAARIQCLDRA
jgi:hypothetical protein